MKNLFRDLGIAIPPNLRDLDTQPTTLLLLTPVSAADIRYDAAGNRWQVTVSQHNLGRVPLEPVTYKRRTLRPFGSSRISRAVMSLTESAMRTVARAEVGAEFFSAPQRYLLGADEDAFQRPDGSKVSLGVVVRGGDWVAGGFVGDCAGQYVVG